MNGEQIKEMQRRINQKFPSGSALVVDGFWGPVSQAKCRAYLRSLMPEPNPWPAADQASLRNFFGAPGGESRLVSIEFPYAMFYGTKKVTTTRVHRKCADSLLRVLHAIKAKYGNDESIMEEARSYGGIFNFRTKRGGSSYSLHAYGAAIDLDVDDNSFRNSWPMQSDMPLEIIEEFAREGWVSGGAFWGYDAMHFQATR